MKKFLLACALLAAGATTWAQTDWVRGSVVKIDRAHKTITIDHGEITSGQTVGAAKVQVGAASEAFIVRDMRLLKGVKVGDRIRFVTTMTRNDLVLTQLQVAP
jgi:Cu/Ag efflux protein CusF